MWPYVLLILLPFLVQNIRIKGIFIKDSNQTAMKLFWVMLLLLLIFRHEVVGRDLNTYHYIFNMISNRSWSEAIGRSAEIGYNLLNKVVSLYTTDFRWIIVITSIFSIYHIAKAYIRYSVDTTLTIMLFINISNFVLLFSGIRQAIAVSIGFLAFEFVRKRKLILFLLIVIIAMLFHTSAFMLLFMYPLYHLKITKKWLIGIVPLLITFFVFNKQIFGYAAIILKMFTKYEAEISSTGAYTVLILFLMFAVFSYLIPAEEQLDDDAIGMRNFLLMSVVLQMFAPLHNLAMRMNYYYMVFIPLLIPKIIECRSVRWKKIAVEARYIMIVFFVIYFFVTAPKDNVLDTFPYKFLWEKV